MTLEKALTTLGLDASKIEIDMNPMQGDFSTNIALKTFAASPKGQWTSPRALAEAIVAAMQPLEPELESVEVAGPGFINFKYKLSVLIANLEALSRNPFASLKPQNHKILVEYSSPNIAKPFTVGHLRSTIIGEALANLFEAHGNQVFRDNHLGDWGTQFGKLIYAIKTWGNLSEIETSERPVKVLVELYQKFHVEAETNPTLEDEARAWFTALENGNQEARDLWQKCIAWSWKEFDSIYKELGCKPFTENEGKGFGESYFEDKMTPVIDELKSKNLLEAGEQGAMIVKFPGDELPPLMILKKDGSTLYATRDLAADKFRLQKYGSDIRVINEVGAEQSLYFKQLFKLEQILGWYQPGQRIHVGHGFFRLKEGKMSTRKGTVIWLEDVLAEAIKRATALAKDESDSTTAKIVGIGALKWNDLKRSAHLDIVFDWDEVLSMEGNSGPYVQYAAVRCMSIIAKASDQTLAVPTNYTPNEAENIILRKLMKFENVITKCTDEFAPHYLCTYLFELAQAYNSFYNLHHVLGEGEATAFRLLLTKVTGNILTAGLEILGIQTPKKM